MRGIGPKAKSRRPDVRFRSVNALRHRPGGNTPSAIATRYFCDVCDAEVREGELRVLRLSLEPDVAVGLLELCPSCAGTLARLLNGVELRRAGAGVIAQAL